MNNEIEQNNEFDDNNAIIEQQSPYYKPERTLPNATATLVLGILSIVMCGPGLIMGIIGIVLHKKDREKYNTNPSIYEQSYKSARAGYICSIVGLSLSALMVVFYILYFVFIVSMLATSNVFTEV